MTVQVTCPAGSRYHVWRSSLSRHPEVSRLRVAISAVVRKVFMGVLLLSLKDGVGDRKRTRTWGTCPRDTGFDTGFDTGSETGCQTRYPDARVGTADGRAVSAGARGREPGTRGVLRALGQEA